MFSDLEKNKLFSEQHYITMERKYQNGCSKERVTTEEIYFINLCIMAAQIKFVDLIS